jgi:uncharacterized protein YkwD
MKGELFIRATVLEGCRSSHVVVRAIARGNESPRFAPHMVRHRTLCIVAASVACSLGPTATAVAACSGSGSRPTQATLDRAVDATVCLINEARADHGLGTLRTQSALERAAAAHSRDMVKRDFFSHDSPSGSTPQQRIDRTGYLDGARSWAVGETIAWGSGGFATPSSIVRGWLKSPGHRAILLGKYREVGVGIALGAPSSGGGGATFTGDFGRR